MKNKTIIKLLVVLGILLIVFTSYIEFGIIIELFSLLLIMLRFATNLNNYEVEKREILK